MHSQFTEQSSQLRLCNKLQHITDEQLNHAFQTIRSNTVFHEPTVLYIRVLVNNHQTNYVINANKIEFGEIDSASFNLDVSINWLATTAWCQCCKFDWKYTSNDYPWSVQFVNFQFHETLIFRIDKVDF